jgi:hypothetical protein
MLKIILSRRIPALFTTMSRPPKVSIALSIIAFEPFHDDTSLASAIASPPRDRMTSTTAWATVSSAPSPRVEPPRSLTTTFAPAAASWTA